MDFLFGLLKNLATSLTPTQFLSVLALIVGAVGITVKMLATAKKKKGGAGLLGLITGAPAGLSEEQMFNDLDGKIQALLTAVESLATSNTLERHADKIMLALAELKHAVSDNEKHVKEQIEHLVELKKESSKLVEEVSRELNDLKHIFKMHDNQQHQEAEAAKELQNRIHGIVARMISQLEKLDEFAKASVPEFRSYSKDITKDISELSRDIALVERSIQNQLNNAQSIKLR